MTAIVRDSVGLQAKLFRGLSDRSRLSILLALRRGARNVTQIVEATGLTQPNTSLHLDCLYCCGLVARERRGRFIYYRVRSRRTLRLLEASIRALEEVADHIEACKRYGE